MAQETALGDVILFLDKIGVYDVVLPFLLVFTIVFAMLEKTKIFGTEKFKGADYPRKNLNAMMAFVTAFLVIASSQLVEAITTISANMVILLLAGVFFLLLVGTFYKPGEEVALMGGWRTGWMWIMFVGLLAIFLNAFKTKAGQTWLEYVIDYLVNYWDSTVFATIVLIIFVIFFMRWVTKSEQPSSGGETQPGTPPA